MRAQQNVLSIEFNVFIYLPITWKYCLAGHHHLENHVTWANADWLTFKNIMTKMP